MSKINDGVFGFTQRAACVEQTNLMSAHHKHIKPNLAIRPTSAPNSSSQPHSFPHPPQKRKIHKHTQQARPPRQHSLHNLPLFTLPLAYTPKRRKRVRRRRRSVARAGRRGAVVRVSGARRGAVAEVGGLSAAVVAAAG
jgi:hypothetical protein